MASAKRRLRRLLTSENQNQTDLTMDLDFACILKFQMQSGPKSSQYVTIVASTVRFQYSGQQSISLGTGMPCINLHKVLSLLRFRTWESISSQDMQYTDTPRIFWPGQLRGTLASPQHHKAKGKNSHRESCTWHYLCPVDFWLLFELCGICLAYYKWRGKLRESLEKIARSNSDQFRRSRPDRTVRCGQSVAKTSKMHDVHLPATANTIWQHHIMQTSRHIQAKQS